MKHRLNVATRLLVVLALLLPTLGVAASALAADGPTDLYLPFVGRGAIPNSPPRTPYSPSPSDGATNQSVTVDLSWSGGDPDGDSVTYDVYFEANDSSPDQLQCDDAASRSCNLPTLSFDAHYYWKVIARDEHGATTTGPVWDFTTGSGGTIGDMIRIPSGTFQMGCDSSNPSENCYLSHEKPLHTVYLDGYFIDNTIC